MSVPQGVVGDDVAALPDDGQQRVEGLAVGALVAVDKGHVEHDAQSGRLDIGVAYAEVYAVGHGRPFYPLSGEVFHLVVDFKGIYLAALAQSLCHADGAIAAECAHLEYALRAYHLYEHLEQTALEMARGHAAVHGMDVGGTPEAVEIVSLGVYMLSDILVYGHLAFNASMARR